MILINTVFLILQDVDLVFMKTLELCGFVSSFFFKGNQINLFPFSNLWNPKVFNIFESSLCV